MNKVQKAYKQYFNNAKGARIYNRFKKILYGTPDSLVVRLFKLLKPVMPKPGKVKILDVGGGDGKRLFALIDLLQNRGIQTDAVLVEPSASFVSSARKKIIKDHLNVKVIHNTFELAPLKDKFDLIIFVHSIFTFGDSNYLKKAKKLLAKGGNIIIIVNKSNSLLAELKQVTDRKFQSKRREIGDVLQDIKRLNLRYKKIESKTLFPSPLKNNKLTKEGKLILEWIALRPYASLSPEDKQEALGVFSGHTKHAKSEEQEVFIRIY